MTTSRLPVTKLLSVLLAVVLAVIGLALAPAPPAEAHAALSLSEPADGGMVATAPAAARLTFSEPVAPLLLRLLGPDGATQELSGASLEGDTLVVPLPPVTAEGTYVLSYRVASQDGHPVGGALVYAVGDAPPDRSAARVPPPSDPAREAAVWASRAALTVGVLFGIGGALFLAFAGGPPLPSARRVVGSALGLATVAAPFAVALQGLDALGLPLSALPQGAMLAAGLASPYTLTVGGALLAAGLAAVSLAAPSLVMRRLTGLIALAVLAFAVSLSGHASSAPPEAITHRAVSVHVAAAAVWVGALVPLALMLAARASETATRALASFSRIVPWAVAALALTGGFLAAVQVRDPAALWTTDYGRVLLAKLALVAAMLVLAAVNRWRLTQPALAGDATARRRLVRVIEVEAVLEVAGVGTLALWRFTPPPRALAAAAAAPAEVHIHTDAGMATLTLTPGRAGPLAVEIALPTADFGALPAKEVRVTFANAAAGIEPIRRPATETEGVWRIDGLTLPVAGVWTVRLDVLISDFETLRLDGTVTLAP
jgi:copper transport protein